MSYQLVHTPPSPADVALGNRLATALGLHPALGKLLVDRNIRTEAEARQFFRPQLGCLHDPFLMNDMQEAVERLNQAMGHKERILVYGDYDVDGVTSVALVYKFLLQYYSNIDYYIPDRYDEGYGVSRKGIDAAKAQGVGLIIVLDCGIKAVEEIAYAKSLGIDFIICDHHVPDEVLPDAAAILNPKRRDNRYPYTELSGCGVGFKFMQAFAMNNGIEFSKVSGLLDLCTISIAADLVPVTGENRILAYHGLRCLNANPSVGIRAIAQICGIAERELTMSDIIFKIGPRINASGRMQSGREAVTLLVEKDYMAALEMASRINTYNEQRRDLDRQMTEEASKQVRQMTNLDCRRSVVIYNAEWHKGVIGIVASRLAEQYYRPAVVLTQSDGFATGSARSVTGFDVYQAIQSCSDLLENFGGHTYAAGMTMRVENVEAFSARFESFVEEHILDEQTLPTLNIDAYLDFKDLSFRFYKDLKLFSPFGPGNEKPIFCTRKVYDYGTSRVVGRGQGHIRLELVDGKSNKVINGIAFGQGGKSPYIKTRRAFGICYTVEENTHKRGEVQLHIVDIRPLE